MAYVSTSRCQCEDAFHFGEQCTHTALYFHFTGGEPLALCTCCVHNAHMTAQRTAVSEAEQETCTAR